MNDDLVERLRLSDGMEIFTASDGKPAIRANTALLREAADKIEEQDAEIERLLGVLRKWGIYAKDQDED